ncbi:hypothetical protein [Hyphomicrobium sp.]|uniref:hypothetical protein n=1 Tax=Hyphomicrobium sp. TaxID=82 RepID=UPI002E37F862|nr:hypothetical protein [Hyphomicrobium sp.]HEX2842463.1 hypothetical protein [Hyphomicrobium sp.]
MKHSIFATVAIAAAATIVSLSPALADRGDYRHAKKPQHTERGYGHDHRGDRNDYRRSRHGYGYGHHHHHRPYWKKRFYGWNYDYRPYRGW